MISDLAIAEIEKLQKDGLKPTPADIVRLNALGLKAEAAKRKNSMTALDYLPRAVKISPTVSFRQPSIGHEIWFDRVDQLFRVKDYQTALAIRAFALSRPAKDLPDPLRADVVADAIREYADTLGEYCTDQIYAAIDYVINGLSPLRGESAPRQPKTSEAVNLYDGEDWKECVAAGILHEGEVALYGLTVAEMESMTMDQLIAAIRRAWLFHGLKVPEEETDREADFYSTLAEIDSRLRKGKDNG